MPPANAMPLRKKSASRAKIAMLPVAFVTTASIQYRKKIEKRGRRDPENSPQIKRDDRLLVVFEALDQRCAERARQGREERT